MYDVAIIGAGVIGCAVARYLAAYQVKACVIDKEEDVCGQTSKANSAIAHAGFDAEPGSLKASMNVLGSQMLEALSKELDFTYRRCGSLVLCFHEADLDKLYALKEKGEKNGVKDLKILTKEEVHQLEPNITGDMVAAIYAPTGAILCPFELTIALAENASTNGIEFKLNTEVKSIKVVDSGYYLKTNNGVVKATCVVNAAGVYTDILHNMVCPEKIHITARKGEYCLLDKKAGSYVSRTIFQLPGVMGKGVLVTPTVHGNLLVGPTAADIDNKEGINTTAAGLGFLTDRAKISVPAVPLRQVITSFAGLRAHEDGDDFVIGKAVGTSGFYDAAGIESPGLTASPAIGSYLAELLAADLKLEKNEQFNGKRQGILKPQELSREEYKKLLKEQPLYGNIICRCEMISEGEIVDAIHRPLGARSLDGVKRRTRAGMGRCQSGFCSPRTMEILEREVPLPIEAITKCGGESKLIYNRNKETL